MTPTSYMAAVNNTLLARISTTHILHLLLTLMVSTLNIASWNVRGINLLNPANIVRRENLVNDSIRFNFYILCLQETKCSEYEEFILNGHKVVLLEQSPSWTHYGLGFIISPALIPCVVAWKSISDRVAYIDLRLSGRNGKSMTMRIVNVYGPTIKRVNRQYQQSLRNFKRN